MRKATITILSNYILVSLFVLCFAACGSNSNRDGVDLPLEQITQVDTVFSLGEDSMKINDFGYVQRAIVHGQKIARDSDDYYLFEILRGSYYFYTMQPDSLSREFNHINNYIQQLPDSPSEYSSKQKNLFCKLMILKSAYFTQMNPNADSALHYINKAKTAFDYDINSSFHVSNRLLVCNNSADIYKQMGQYDRSIEALKSGLLLADSAKMRPDTYMVFYMGISAAYTAIRDFNQSSVWWNKTYTLWPYMSDFEKFSYFNNRGSDYYYQGKYRKALDLFLRVDSLCDAEKNMEFERMFAHVNQCDIYLKFGDIAKVRQLIAETDAFFTKYAQTDVLDYIMTQKINLCMLERELTKARSLAMQHPLTADKGIDMTMQRLRVLTALYRATGDKDMYISVADKYHHLNDSLQDSNVKMRCSEMIVSYNHDKKLTGQQMEIEKKDAALNLSIIIMAAASVCILLLVVIVCLVLKQRKMREVEYRHHIVSLRMENARNRITPHFIFNALNHERQAQMEGKQIQLETIVTLLRKGQQMADVFCTTLADELDFIRYYVDIEGESLGDDFRYAVHIDKDIDVKAVQLPSMIVQIFVENAIKHGLKSKPRKEGEFRTLDIMVSRKDQGILIAVTDNGLGVSSPAQLAGHTGLKVVRQTLQLLNERNKDTMYFNIENIGGNKVPLGCCSSLYIPHHFKCEI